MPRILRGTRAGEWRRALNPSSDSLSQVAIELAKLFEPLGEALATPHPAAFFAQVGIPLTAAQSAALGGPLSTIVTRTEEMAALIPALVAALDADDFGTVAEQALAATAKVGDIIAALDALSSAAQGLAVPDAGELAERIFNYLLAQYVDSAHGLNDTLEFLGLLERQDFDVDSSDPAHPPFTISTYHLGAISEWLSDPAAKASSLYGWGPGFDGHLLFPRVEQLLAMIGAPVIYDPATTPQILNAVMFELEPASSGSPGLVIRFKADIPPGTQTVSLGEDATLEVTAEIQPPVDTEVTISTDGSVTFLPPSPASLSGAIGAKVTVRRDDPPEPLVLFGQAGGSRLEIGAVILAVAAELQDAGGSAHGAVDVSGTLNDGKVVIDASQGDGFVGKTLPATHFEADFSLLMGVSTKRGFYFGGSSALEVRVPMHISLGPVSIEALTFTAALADGHIPVSVGADIRALLGPVEAVVQNMGVTATLSFPPHNSGNLGPLQLDIGFKPPSGVGLRVNAGPISGGGFLSLDSVKGEYVGALELSFNGIFSLKAIGIINTKMPDGSKGFALLILVTAEFAPIQLGFAFTLNGVGGLLALNRSLDSEALRLGVRTGSVSSVLFPPDVIGNITQIVSDLKAFFPIVQGHFVVAPMGKLGWGTPTLISLELGIVLDIPSPQLTIIGVLRCILPRADAPILKLQVNFAGGIDFERGSIWFDASLFDSSLLTFTLTGDLALRVSWGDQKVLVVSVGGFHPAFHEVPSDLTGMRRLTIALLSGENPRLVAQTYFAVTSNTVQTGARVELYASACGFNIYGFLGYDVLVQVLPFHIVAQLAAGLALRRGTSVIAGIHVTAELSGPTPWHVHGHGSFSVLFFSVSIGFDATWGDPLFGALEELADVLSLVVDAVHDVRNWVAELPANVAQTVSLRLVEATDTVLLHPFGVLSVSQKVAPLELPIDRFGNRTPTGDTTFTMALIGSGATEPAREQFAVANFVSMTDSEKLARRSFEDMQSGLRFSAADGALSGASVGKDVTYEMSYLRHEHPQPGGRFDLFGALFDTFSRGGAVQRNKLSVFARKRGGNGPSAVEVDLGEFHVVSVTDLSPAKAGAVARTQAEAFAMRDALVRADPSLAGTLQVMAAHELFIADAA